MKGQEVVRMVPNKDGHANHGHSCVKGRFAFGYATHKDRIKKPMIRETIHEPWREVSWDEAFTFTANKIKSIQAKYGKGSVGGITSSRCTNEETYLVQKLVRAAFGNNNVDTCARVCHSPTGYGLKATLGESAGTQAFDSVMKSDVILVIGANPTEAHPVFASQMKRRLREGAKLIVVDPRADRPRALAACRSAVPSAAAARHQRRDRQRARARDRVRGAREEGLRRRALRRRGVQGLARVHPRSAEFPRERGQGNRRRPADQSAAPRACSRRVPNAAIYYGLGVTEHSQGSTTVIAIANLAMCTGNIGREGVGVNPLRGQNNVQGSCDMGSFPHELPGYRHVSDPDVRALFGKEWGVEIQPDPGLRIPNMFDAAVAGQFKALYVQGEDVAQSDPDTHHVTNALSSLECMIVQDLFLNETAKFAHVFLPGSSFLEKNGTFTNAERRISPVRKVMEPLAGLEDWEVTQRLSQRARLPDELLPSVRDHGRDRAPHADLHGRELREARPARQHPVAVQRQRRERHADDAHRRVRARQGPVQGHAVRADRRGHARAMYPLLLTTGRILSQYNVGAQTRRTANVEWHDEDVLEIHPHDAEQRGIEQGDWVGLRAAPAKPCCAPCSASAMQPGVVYTTFHHPYSGANVVTTDNSDWATNCPEYKVTAVQAHKVTKLSDWQKNFEKFTEEQLEHLNRARSPEDRGLT